MEKVMEKIKLDPETSALILIDLQHGIVAIETSPHPASSVVAKAASLAAAFRKHSSTVIYIRVDLAKLLQVPADRSHGDPKNPPPAIASELVPASGVQAGDHVVTKRHWSAFSGTDLEVMLKKSVSRSSTLKKALAMQDPVIVGVPVDYRGNHRVMENVHPEALN
jgi:nicotinamidase-related amidase